MGAVSGSVNMSSATPSIVPPASTSPWQQVARATNVWSVVPRAA